MTLPRRALILAAPALLLSRGPLSGAERSPDAIADVLARADHPELRAIVVRRDAGDPVERGYNGFTPGDPTNIKSASKSIVSALAGIAIGKGLLDGPDQPVAPLLADALPEAPDPRIARITLGNLLSMQAGLERMSGPNYGAWVSSRDWVRAALAAPFVADPGTVMLYSTASTHLVSAILTRVSRRTTLTLARDWLGPVEGFRIDGWDRDPRGIYIGGNQMAMSTRSLAAFGELYRRGGDGIVPADWIAESWTPRTRSSFSNDGYGYCWFMRRIGGERCFYGWGYGGQMLYVLPGPGMTIAMTSNPDLPSARTGYRDALHALAGEIVAAA